MKTDLAFILLQGAMCVALLLAPLATVDFKPTLLGLLGLPRDPQDKGRDASTLFLNGKAPADWKNVTFSRNANGNWLMAVSSRYKFIVYPDTDPCLFDLGQDPFEMRNLFSTPASRPIVRELAQALLGYAQRSKEPYAAEPAMHADLAWAAAGTGAYAPPHRDAAKARKARVVNEDGE